MPKQLHILLNLLALFVITYIVVDIFYGIIGVGVQRLSGPEELALQKVEARPGKSIEVPVYNKIVERNIFGATEKVVEAPVEEVKPVETLEETQLELSLLGTIAGDSASARAIILDKRKRSQDIYRIGDSVQEAEIRQILRGKVILRHGDKDEVLLMVEGEDKTQAAEGEGVSRRGRAAPRRSKNLARPASLGSTTGEVEEERISIAQDDLQTSMNDLNELMTQVRVRPYFRRGKPEGIIVSRIQPDSIFAKLGLMNGDIIASVNGKQMSSPDEAFQFYNSLKSGEKVSIEITRRGRKRVLSYDIQ
ncbi:MAG: PDZ domain-containing protein [Deltaproteobacteria bacterium]|jgi:general secretion pathway protein C|nr:PDZ domain-containing protein [Deltaproteobacteria bacterium]